MLYKQSADIIEFLMLWGSQALMKLSTQHMKLFIERYIIVVVSFRL